MVAVKENEVSHSKHPVSNDCIFKHWKSRFNGSSFSLTTERIRLPYPLVWKHRKEKTSCASLYVQSRENPHPRIGTLQRWRLRGMVTSAKQDTVVELSRQQGLLTVGRGLITSVGVTLLIVLEFCKNTKSRWTDASEMCTTAAADSQPMVSAQLWCSSRRIKI